MTTIVVTLKLRQCRDVTTTRLVSNTVTVAVTRHTNVQIEVHCYGNKSGSEIC